MKNRLFLIAILLPMLGALRAEAMGRTPPSEPTTQTAKTKTGDTWSCQLPTSVPAPTASQRDFDLYSWQMFVALNWPAQAGERGQPDCSEPLGTAAPTVWETYKTVNEIFLPNGADPGPWNTPFTTPQVTKINIAAVKNATIANEVNQAVGGWLIDQRGNPTYYQLAANEISYNYIVTNDFYNADVVSKADNIDFPASATEIKASWRILTASDDASHYLTIEAQVEQFDAQGIPTGTTKPATLGLVGLHIITKAPGYPQWIWATFEQIDNVPPKVDEGGQWVDQPVPGVFYSYFDPSAPANELNSSPCNWERKGAKLVCQPKPGQTFSTPDPLDRVTPIDSVTREVNMQARTDLSKTPLRYYHLITTQRPLMPDNPGNPLGQPTPALSANVSMESYIQSNSSCMSCHSMATPVKSPYKSDFSYLFKFAQAPAAGPEHKPADKE